MGKKGRSGRRLHGANILPLIFGCRARRVGSVLGEFGNTGSDRDDLGHPAGVSLIRKGGFNGHEQGSPIRGGSFPVWRFCHCPVGDDSSDGMDPVSHRQPLPVPLDNGQNQTRCDVIPAYRD